MMGEQEAIVVGVRPLTIHGMAYVDLAVVHRDRSVSEARLGPESVPDHLSEGETVLVTKVANMVISVRRP